MFGLCALPNRVEDARQSIDQAIEYGTAIGAGAVHVMAGKAEGTAADEVFVGNLRYACDKAPDGMTILIEPLNKHDAPGYFLGSLAKACDVIEAVGHNRLKLMFDCYHVARTEGDVATQLRSHIDMTGHIQFAGVPDRGEPDRGQVDYAEIFALIADLGWDWPLGAEYRPSGEPDQTLQWMGTLR